MKKFAGALLVLLMLAAGLLFSASPSSAQDETEDETQGEIEEAQTEGEVAAGLDPASEEYQRRVEEWARRGAEAGMQALQNRLNSAIEDLQERLLTLEGRLGVATGSQWLPEFCLRWVNELNGESAILADQGGSAGGETRESRFLAGELLRSRSGAMLILIVNGVELCAMRFEVRN